jgi:hypothetical protein
MADVAMPAAEQDARRVIHALLRHGTRLRRHAEQLAAVLSRSHVDQAFD